MSLEEEGAYIRLLCHCWLYGSIPADEQQAIKLLGKGGYNVAITTVLSMFQPGPKSGELVHDRLEAERRKQADWKAKSIAGGIKSAEKRWGKPTDIQHSDKGCLRNGSNQSVTLLSASASSSAKKDIGRNAPTSDLEWFQSLKSNPAYEGLNIETEYGKMRAWCGANSKQPSRRRFVNWLNRADRPMLAGPKQLESDAATQRNVERFLKGKNEPIA
jgi:uncharacterized protein YdaU (DUF1376 family)